MTDADRLRAAANALDSRVFAIRRVAREVQWMPTEGCDEYKATASLLLAVAGRHVSDSDGDRCFNCREPWPCPEAAAALALADVVLGGDDE